MAKNIIQLQADSPREIEISAQFVAELQRQGLAFKVERDNVGHFSGLNAVPGFIVTIHGY